MDWVNYISYGLECTSNPFHNQRQCRVLSESAAVQLPLPILGYHISVYIYSLIKDQGLWKPCITPSPTCTIILSWNVQTSCSFSFVSRLAQRKHRRLLLSTDPLVSVSPLLLRVKVCFESLPLSSDFYFHFARSSSVHPNFREQDLWHFAFSSLNVHWIPFPLSSRARFILTSIESRSLNWMMLIAMVS